MHEALLSLFRHRPAVVAELLRERLDPPLPQIRQARLESADFVDITPTEYRADAVVVLGAAEPVLAVVVEAQLRRDPGKRWSWPVYVATLRARLQCPTVLLVLCVDTGVATWCAKRIDLGPGFHLVPTVLGPEVVPVVTDPEQAARAPELAVLSVLAHGQRPGGGKVLEAFYRCLSAVATVDADGARLYADLVHVALPRARRNMEDLMRVTVHPYTHEFIECVRIQERGASVVAVLEGRGIKVPDDAYERILECMNEDQVNVWLNRAVTAASVDELFD
jgi:hypothetical protein